MKKIIVALAAAALLFSSCSGDTCKCTYKDEKGNVQNFNEPKPSDASCADIAKTKEEKLNAAATLVGSSFKVNVSCKTVNAE